MTSSADAALFIRKNNDPGQPRISFKSLTGSLMTLIDSFKILTCSFRTLIDSSKL